MPMVVWWLVGDLSEPNGDLRVITPIMVGPGVERFFRLVSAAVFVWSGAALASAGGRYLSNAARRRVLVQALMLGAVAGGAGRIVTAAVGGGGNIGGGILFFFGTPVMLYAIVRTVQRARSI